MISFKFLFVILPLLFFIVACSGREPTPRTARSASLSYFKKYGRKYEGTQFSNKNVSNVTINSIEEISFKFALVDTIIAFVDGHSARALVRMENKFPQGWTVVSWEMLGYR